MTPEQARLSSCEGKVGFATPALAYAVQKRRGRKSHKRGKQYRTNEPYHCAHCGKWHIGSRPVRLGKGSYA